jgi:hypothetical protein
LQRHLWAAHAMELGVCLPKEWLAPPVGTRNLIPDDVSSGEAVQEACREGGVLRPHPPLAPKPPQRESNNNCTGTAANGGPLVFGVHSVRALRAAAAAAAVMVAPMSTPAPPSTQPLLLPAPRKMLAAATTPQAPPPQSLALPNLPMPPLHVAVGAAMKQRANWSLGRCGDDVCAGAVEYTTRRFIPCYSCNYRFPDVFSAPTCVYQYPVPGAGRTGCFKVYVRNCYHCLHSAAPSAQVHGAPLTRPRRTCGVCRVHTYCCVGAVSGDCWLGWLCVCVPSTAAAVTHTTSGSSTLCTSRSSLTSILLSVKLRSD